MCLAVPMRLVEKEETSGVAEMSGVRREVSLLLVPEADLGDYVLIHAGYAIGKVDEEEAKQPLALLSEIIDSEEFAP